MTPDEPEHKRDPSWRCTVLDPFTNRELRDGIGTYERCPACAKIEEKLWPTISKVIIPRRHL